MLGSAMESHPTSWLQRRSMPDQLLFNQAYKNTSCALLFHFKGTNPCTEKPTHIAHVPIDLASVHFYSFFKVFSLIHPLLLRLLSLVRRLAVHPEGGKGHKAGHGGSDARDPGPGA